MCKGRVTVQGIIENNTAKKESAKKVKSKPREASKAQLILQKMM
jgi:hypothetical protein